MKRLPSDCVRAPFFVAFVLLMTLFVWMPSSVYAQDVNETSGPVDDATTTANPLPTGWTVLDQVNQDGYTKWRLPVDSACSFSDHNYTLDLPEDPKRMSDIRLTMTNYDVDYLDPQDCEGGPEFDNADLNGAPLGILTGANGSWSINTWALTQSNLVKGGNHIYIDTDATGTGCWCVGVGYIELQAKVDFQILEMTPTDGELNRDFHADRLDLAVTFTTDLNAASVNNDTFVLNYRNQAGAVQEVAGSFTLVAPNKFRFVPNADLIDGVRYYATVIGGPNGVKSASDVPLDATRTWSFWTVPDLNATDSFDYDNGHGSYCPPTAAPCAGIEVAVFQAVRNGAMVPTKDTVARLYLRWKRHSDVHVDDQLKELSVKVNLDIVPGGGNIDTVQSVKRPDQYTAAQIGAGLNTINIYHKPPSGFTYNAQITPQPQSNVVPVVFNASKVLANTGKSATISFNHYFLKDGEWVSGVPSNIKTDALNVLASGSQTTLDMFPVIGVNAINKGDITIGYTFTGAKVAEPNCGMAKEVMCPVGATMVKKSEPQCIYQKLSTLIGGFKIVSITVPQSICPDVGGAAFGKVLMLVPTSNPVVIAHEVGHAYGISTVNNPNNGHRNSPDGIEGFQVRTKLNRSRVENPGLAISLMHTGPIAAPIGQWIHKDDYATLVGTVAQAQIARVQADQYLLVSGLVDLEGASVQLEPLFVQTDAILPDAGGNCTAELLDGANGVLDSASFTPGVETHTWTVSGISQTDTGSISGISATGLQPFAVTLAWDESAQVVRINCGGPPLITQSRSAAVPTADFVDLAEGATLSTQVVVNWTGNDADSATLFYQLQFSEDGGATWTPLTPISEATTHSIDTTALPSGTNRKVRLLVSDGFNNAFVERTVTIANDLMVLAQVPPDFGEDALLNTTIQATFNTPIDPQTLSDATFYVEQGGSPISGTLTLGADPRVVLFQPTDALEPASYYSVRVDDTLKDVTGSTLPFSNSWLFQTISDTVPPFLERTSPADGEINVPPNALIAAQFNEDLEFNSTLESISVVNGDGEAVAGTTNYLASDSTLVFAPKAKLAPNTRFKVTIAASVTDTNDNPLESARSWYFTTGATDSPSARIVGNYDELVQDLDGDGLYDVLTIFVDVQSGGGFYNLNARLVDKAGQLIQWKPAHFGNGFFEGILDQGVHRLALNFDASAIRVHQVDGPYFLDSLNFYNEFNPQGGDTRFDVYQTLPYSVTSFSGVLSFKPLPDRLLEWSTTRDNAWNLRDYTVSLIAPLASVTYTIVGNSDPRVGVTIDANNFIDINPDPDVEVESTVTIEARDSEDNRTQGSFVIYVQKPAATTLIAPLVLTVPRNTETLIEVEVQDQFKHLFAGEEVELSFSNLNEMATITPETISTTTGAAKVQYASGPELGEDTITVYAGGGVTAEIAVVIADEVLFLPKVEN